MNAPGKLLLFLPLLAGSLALTGSHIYDAYNPAPPPATRIVTVFRDSDGTFAKESVEVTALAIPETRR